MLLLSFVTLVYFYSVDLTITVTRSCLNLILQYHLLQFESIPFECLCFLLLLFSTSTVSTRFMRPQTALRWLQRFATFSSSSLISSSATFTLLNLHHQFHHCHLHASSTSSTSSTSPTGSTSAGRTKSSLGLEHGSEVPMLGKDFWRFCTIAARLRKIPQGFADEAMRGLLKDLQESFSSEEDYCQRFRRFFGFAMDPDALAPRTQTPWHPLQPKESLSLCMIHENSRRSKATHATVQSKSLPSLKLLLLYSYTELKYFSYFIYFSVFQNTLLQFDLVLF